MDTTNNQRKLVILIAAALVTVLGLAVINFVGRYGKIAVKVVLVPADSTLTIDGKKSRAGTIYFSKKKHTLVAKRQYFTTATKTVDFSSYKSSQTLYLTPSPDSQAALNYLTAHPDAQAQRESIAGVRAGVAQQQLSKDKLLTFLPYTAAGFEYVVDYSTDGQPDGSQKVTIYIEANTDQAKQDALAWIKSKKIDPSSLTIVYEALPVSSSSGSNGEGPSQYQ